MDLAIFGRQGSGKGTQVQNLVEHNGYAVFAMSAELKKVIKSGSELGLKIKALIDAGNLVPDAVVMEIVKNWAENEAPNAPVLFDGIPRTLVQMEMFEEIMHKAGREYKGLLINLPEEEAIKRMLGRKVNEDGIPVPPDFVGEEYLGKKIIHRADDNPEAIAKRLALYKTETLPVVEKYREIGKLIEVDGLRHIDEVYQEISEKIA